MVLAVRMEHERLQAVRARADAEGLFMRPADFTKQVEGFPRRVVEGVTPRLIVHHVAAYLDKPVVIELVLAHKTEVGVAQRKHLVVDEGSPAELAEGGVGIRVGVKVVGLVDHAAHDDEPAVQETLGNEQFRQVEITVFKNVAIGRAASSPGIVQGGAVGVPVSVAPPV